MPAHRIRSPRRAAAPASAAILLAFALAGCAPEPSPSPSPPAPAPAPPVAASGKTDPARSEWGTLQKIGGVGRGDAAPKVEIPTFSTGDASVPTPESVAPALAPGRTVDSAPFEITGDGSGGGGGGALRLRVTLDSRESLPRERDEDRVTVRLVKEGRDSGAGPSYEFKGKPTPGLYSFVRPLTEKVAPPGRYCLSVDPASRAVVADGATVANAYAWEVTLERKKR